MMCPIWTFELPLLHPGNCRLQTRAFVHMALGCGPTRVYLTSHEKRTNVPISYSLLNAGQCLHVNGSLLYVTWPCAVGCSAAQVTTGVVFGSFSWLLNWNYISNCFSFPYTFFFQKGCSSLEFWQTKEQHAFSNIWFLLLFCILSSINLLLQEPTWIFDLFWWLYRDMDLLHSQGKIHRYT